MSVCIETQVMNQFFSILTGIDHYRFFLENNNTDIFWILRGKICMPFMLNFILYNYSNISKITCFGSCIQNLFRWKVLKVFVTFNYSWRHWTCLLQQFSQLMVEWCEPFDSFEARSFYYTMPCHWYQFSVLGQFIPCGVAHSVSCSETIRSTSRQEYNACKYLDSLLRAISCPTERHLISPRWAEDVRAIVLNPTAVQTMFSPLVLQFNYRVTQTLRRWAL